ncbi:hypothetical protein HID58_087178, partial [Brassica napus]
ERVRKKGIMKSRLFQTPKGTTKSHHPKKGDSTKARVSKRRLLRKLRPHNRSRGSDSGATLRLLVDPPRQEQMSAILFFRIPMLHSLLQPFFHDLPSGRRLHLLNNQIPASHHWASLDTATAPVDEVEDKPLNNKASLANLGL